MRSCRLPLSVFILISVLSSAAFFSGCYGSVTKGGDSGEDAPDDGVESDDGLDPDGTDLETDGADIPGMDCLIRGIPDDDMDTISNDMEGGGAVDTDFDGIPDASDPDSDNDTIPDLDEAGRTNCMMTPEDFDGDEVPNFRDQDSDGDLIRDEHEGSGDSDADGPPNYLDLDSDNDGIGDGDEAGDYSLSTPPLDTDGDTIPDFVDVDSDDDGLYDFEEVDLGTDPRAADTDGDGVDDAIEVMVAFDPVDFGHYPRIDRVVELEYGAGSVTIDMDMTTDLSRADVYFLIDTSGSMSQEIDIVRYRIIDTIIPELLGLFPDLEMGVGEFRDECDTGYFPFRNRAALTNDSAVVQTALSALTDGGGCGYSTYMEGLYVLAEGGSQSWPGCGLDVLPDPACSAMRWGYPCFRNGSLPLVVILTDVQTRCDRCQASYSCSSPPLHPYMDVVYALVEKGIKIVGIDSGEGEADLRMLAGDTGSLDSAGAAVVYEIPEDGTGLVEAVVDGVSRLSIDRLMDVSAIAVEFPAIDDGIDAEGFVVGILPQDFTLPTPDTPAPTIDSNGFYGVTPGTILSFDAILENDHVPPAHRLQVFLVEIRVVDQAGARLNTLTLLIAVPGLDLEILEGEGPVACTYSGDCVDDGLSCTETSCSGRGRCHHVPVDALCDDGDPCNGLERCRPDFGHHDTAGCIAGLAMTCGVSDPCLVSSCRSVTGECEVSLVDVDGDGHAPMGCRLCDDSGTCITGDDCNDTARAIHPEAAEICDDGLDNDCDRRNDILDLDCTMQNDTCALAEILLGPGSYPGSLVGAGDDLVLTCDPRPNLDAVYAITLTEDHDLSLQVSSSMPTTVSVRSVCADEASELYCAMNGVFAWGLRAGTYYIIVEGDGEGTFSLSVDVLPYTEVHIVPATNDTCAEPYVIPAEGGLFIGTTTGLVNDFTASCGGSSASPDAVFEMTLEVDKYVTFSTSTNYDGTLHLHDAPCLGAEIGCNDDNPDTRHSRITALLAPGTYYLVVDGYSSSNSGNYELQVIVTDP